MTARKTPITATVENITPAKAKELLATNNKNRKMRVRTIKAFARDMAAGRWLMAGEPIKIDTEGNLKDGQHRLTAIIEAQTSVPMLVVRGVSPESQRVMDSGIKRNATDQLDMAGRKNTRIMAAAARLALIEPSAGFVAEPIDQPTTTEVLEFIEAFDTEITEASQMAAFFSHHIPIPPSVTCVAWMNFTQIDPDACMEFFDSMKQQRLDGEGDPRLALIRRLTKTSHQTERMPARQALSLVYRAWNAWRSGNTIRTLPTHTRGEEVPVPEKLR
jgi:hypothetical protein